MTSTSFKTILITIAVGIAILVGAELISGSIAAARAKRSNGSTTTPAA